MTCICGHQWWWLCKGKYSNYHYSYWNVFGWASMQYTVDWSKCKVLLYYTLMIFVLFPAFMLWWPLVMMWMGMYDPLRTYDNCLAGWCHIPRWMVGHRYTLGWRQIILLTIFYLPFVLILGLTLGILFFAIFYPFAVLFTIWKMIKLTFRDWRCFQTMKY